MANLLASYSFPDNYYTNLVESAASVKYVSASGSDSNNGNTVGTPYLTIAQALSATSATSTAVTIVVLQGTYTLTPGVSNGGNGAMLTDSNKPRIFVCCPGKTILQYTATVSDRDAGMIDFQNSGSAIYGAILKRNNNGRTTNYMTSFFINTFYRQQGKFYNCVFSETNANNLWSIQYDNNNNAIPAVFNCTFYNAAASGSDYGGTSSWAITDTVFNTTVTTNVTLTRVTQSATVNATTYVATGITTAGVYSGTYSWSGTTTLPMGIYANAATIVYGGSVQFTLNSSNVTTGNVPYTISGVTSALISNASLTGNFVMSAGTGAVTVTATSGTYSNVNVMTMAADGYTSNVTINPNVTIYLTSIIGVSGTADSSYIEYPVPGQMNIIQSSVTTTDVTLGATPLLPVLNQQSNTVSVSYTTMTNSIAGPIEAGVIKLFGDSPQREYWM